jgi:gamma-glutamylcyclotransferase (GGCT)/AIG2-like uncharacterized protein YtfP
MVRVFVYGTLRPSLRNKYGFYKRTDIPQGKKIGEGVINGVLYPISNSVPGLKLEDTLEEVVGEIVEFTEDEMVRIDYLESAYTQRKVVVKTADGLVDAITYEYKGSPFAPRVVSGDWAVYLKGTHNF